MDPAEHAPAERAPAARWGPLDRFERRVAGVLVEKAKTTPENYPLSLNALVTGCNQKSNRFPQMQLDEAQVEAALDHLRQLGAVSQIQGDGRVDKYRHLLYDWLGVDKTELAVMAELLLRGAQTLGDLRGRAARMEAIRDIGALHPIVDALHRKRLIQFLTPPGRGGIVTHNLYQPQELPKLREEHGNYADPGPGTVAAGFALEEEEEPAPAPTAARPAVAPPRDDLASQVAELRRELHALREETAAEIAALREAVAQRTHAG